MSVFEEEPPLYFAIISKFSGKALDFSRGNGPSRNKLIIWSYHGGDNQKFAFKTVGSHQYILSKSGMYLTVESCSKENKAKIVGKPFDGSLGQRFSMRQNGLEYCIFTHCGKVLDIEASHGNDGSYAIQY